VAPNPARADAQLRFVLPVAGPVRVRVFDVAGREVARPIDGVLTAGDHRVTLATAGMAAGVYHVVLSSHGSSRTTRFVHLR
jgi:hypothetical protein